MQLCRDYQNGKQLLASKEAVAYARDFIKEDKEYFVVLGLNNQNRVIYKDIVSIGTVNASLVHPREVFKQAISKTAVSIITMHNHPSGELSPSHQDITIWKRLSDSGEIIGIKILDHLFVSTGGHYSAREGGFI